ncbi:hypothetical protein SESBI_02471 [Sesbania bispinosa]|nr:hypothetical protein SESBI_02471 [Sesbania bispinosa]
MVYGAPSTHFILAVSNHSCCYPYARSAPVPVLAGGVIFFKAFAALSSSVVRGVAPPPSSTARAAGLYPTMSAPLS